MLVAVLMCGRWISKNILKRISDRARAGDPPTRRELLKEFCRRVDWRNRKGELCLSSANVCVKRLEAQGLISLPPPLPRAQPASKRRLLDDGQPLPPLPKLPPTADKIADLHWSLIANANDAEHLVWNRLISRQHPLKGAPLVGAQLRYLLLAGSEVV